jgi:hypothetical protein
MDAPRRLWPSAELRVGDTDRQTVVAELQRHFIDGRLTGDELGERVDQALHARTFADLAVLLTDLPTLDTPSSSTSLEPAEHFEQDAPHFGFGPPLGAILVVIGIISILSMLVFPMYHMGGIGFWPILIWGFFFIGRPPRGGRRNRWHNGGGPPTRYH